MEDSWLGFLLFCFTVLGDSFAADRSASRPKVHAYVGFPVILPCRKDLSKESDFPTVEWSKPSLNSKPFVFVLRDKYEMHNDKNKDFEFRTHLFMSEVDNGNFDMRLSDTRKEDEGMYVCKTMWAPNRFDEYMVDLIVEDLPMPAMSVVSLEDGSVTLSCHVRTCSTARPHLAFLDAHGNILTADAEQLTPEDQDCYRLERQVKAQPDAKSVLCRAEFPSISHNRDVHIVIPEYTKESCTLPMVGVGVGVGIGVLFLAVLVLAFVKRRRKSGKSQKTKDKKKIINQSLIESVTSSGSETNPFLQHQSTVITENEETGEIVAIDVPDLLTSTPASTVSRAEGVRSNVIDIFSDSANNNNDEGATSDGQTTTCEINYTNKSVKFEIKDEESRGKLTRQDANCDDRFSKQKKLSKSVSSLPLGICASANKKCIMKRSRSVSESSSVHSDGSQHRRLSLSSWKFEILKEESE